MRSRCHNPNDFAYKHYGLRGIRVCDRWKKFLNFVSDMGDRPTPKHQINRIDNDGNYCPENCEWATQKQQANNTRRNRLITVRGETKTVAQWSELTGMPQSTIWRRLHSRWSDEDTILLSKRQGGKRKLTWQQAQQVRNDPRGAGTIAREFGVNDVAIRRIKLGLTYRSEIK